MKTKIICILIAVTILAGLQQAQAGDKEKYLLGGLIGGWILNDVLDVNCHSSVSVDVYDPCPPVVVHRPAVRYYTAPVVRYRQVRVWVPGHYERVVTHYGRPVRRWIPGRYTYRRHKVRVPARRPHYSDGGHGHGQHDTGGGYGQGRSQHNPHAGRSH